MVSEASSGKVPRPTIKSMFMNESMNKTGVREQLAIRSLSLSLDLQLYSVLFKSVIGKLVRDTMTQSTASCGTYESQWTTRDTRPAGQLLLGFLKTWRWQVTSESCGDGKGSRGWADNWACSWELCHSRRLLACLWLGSTCLLTVLASDLAVTCAEH